MENPMKLSSLSLALIITLSNIAFASQSPTNKDKACPTRCAEIYAFALGHLSKSDVICYQMCLRSCTKNAGQTKNQSPTSSPREKTTTK
jgi:hypothetical protein